jgi:uncharacterized membrane protein YbhN (UPF0104 family)
MTQKTSPRTRLWTFAKAILAVALIGFTISRTDLHELLSLREHMVWNWLWVYSLLYFSLTLLKAYQYRKLLNLPIPYARMVSIVVLQNGISNIIANSAGIASYLVMLRGEQGVSTGRAALVFVITKIGDLFAIWMVLLVSSTLLWNQLPALHDTIIALELTIGAPLFGFLLVVFLRQRMTNFMRNILERTKLIRISIVSQGMNGLDALVNEKHGSIFEMTVTALVLSMIYFLVTIAWYVAQLRLFSISLGFVPITFVTTILQMIAFLPITILGGLGIIETSSLYLYTLVGVEPVSFAADLIGLRALFYAINLVILLYLPIYSFFDSRRKK